MALAYKTVIRSVGLSKDDTMTVSLGLLIVNGDVEVASSIHTYVAAAGEDPFIYLQVVLDDIATQGYPALEASDIDWLTRCDAARKNGATIVAPE